MGLGTPPIQGALRLGSPGPNYLASSSTGASSIGGIAPGGATNGRPASGLGMGLVLQPTHAPTQSAVQQQQQPQPTQGQGKDPFADLVGLF